VVSDIVERLEAVAEASRWPGQGAGDRGDEALRRSSVPPPPEADSIVGVSPEGAASHDTGEEPEFDRPQFTTLDKVLIRAVISSLNDVKGALDEDSLDDLVQETLELNDDREQSYFHRGFLDALMERECQPMGPGENNRRRAWYLVGYCQGVWRRKGSHAGALFIASLPAEDAETLLGGIVDAGVFLAPLLIKPLLDHELFESVERWIRLYLVRCASDIIPVVVGWSRMALLASDPGCVEKILELCREEIEKRKGLDAVPPKALVERLERRLAIALRLQGKVTQAETIVDRLLDEDLDSATRSKLLGDKLLLRMGRRSLEDLRIGKEETREALTATLEGVSERLETALERTEATSLVTDLAAAVYVVLSETDASSRIESAIDCLLRAIRALEDWNVSFWTEKGVLPRARFYLSVLELRLLDPAKGAPAVTRLVGLMRSGLSEPIDIVTDAVNHAVIQDLQDSHELARSVLQRWPQAALARLDLGGLAGRNAQFRARVVDALDANEELLTVAERWSAWDDVRKGALAADERDVETAQRALDELEKLADIHGCQQQFTDLLASDRNWDPAWSPLDALMARYRLAEASGQMDLARSVLFNIAHQAITGRHADAGDLVERLDQLEADPDAVGELRCRLQVSIPPEPAPVQEDPVADVPVSIFFIGGNETQAAYETAITKTLSRTHEGCSVHFENTCWSSNWGRELGKYGQLLNRVDAVVIMRFIRTELGRRMRKAAGEAGVPWIPCVGHGRDSMILSITRAIDVARVQKGRASQVS